MVSKKKFIKTYSAPVGTVDLATDKVVAEAVATVANNSEEVK